MKSVEEICDRVVLIDHARKIAEGSVTELREQRKSGVYAVRFRGNMLSFVNALWTGFEVVDKDVLGDDRYVVRVRMRNESNFEDLLKVLMGQVKIEAAWEMLPDMQEVFISLVQRKEESHEE
jgi:ABC-2 type transport system ATP-binding protein